MMGFYGIIGAVRLWATSGRHGLYRLISTFVKISIASLATGFVLNKLDLSAEQVLLELGMTPDNVLKMLEAAMKWAVPHLVLGSLVIVPVWLVVYLFRPPRG